MVAITWLPKTWGKAVWVTKAQGVAEHLKEVSEEIDALPAAVRAAAYPIAGVFACRPVADTGKMSMHGYAAAIDLNLKFSTTGYGRRKLTRSPIATGCPKKL